MDSLINKAKELMQYARKYGVDEVLITDGAKKIHIGKNLGVAPVVTSVAAAPVAVSAETAVAPAPEVIEEETMDLQQITSPMAGTFYRAPSPGADPFVKEGQKIAKGDVVCIVEAMKNMNQIKSPYDGVVKHIRVENAGPVAKSQVLIEIE
jgi:acetyl-CoA carboxylase biotin carboxyl carrier protein